MNNVYLKISLKEEGINVLGIAVFLLAIGRVYYGNYMFGILLLPGMYFILKQRNKKIRERIMADMESQFRDMLISLADIMRVGYSMENALVECYQDMAREHGKESMICRELVIMIRQIKMNERLVDVFNNFYNRTKISYIRDFIKTFAVAQNTGGNLIETIGSVAKNISMKQNVKEEIQVEIRSRTLEQKIMCFVPFLVTAYVSLTSSNTMNVMYSTWIGRGIMTVCLILYLLSFIWSEKVEKIEV